MDGNDLINIFYFMGGAAVGLSLGIVGNLWVTLKYRLKDEYPWSSNYQNDQKLFRLVNGFLLFVIFVFISVTLALVFIFLLTLKGSITI